MADPDRDAVVSAQYRALGREEPPRELDDAILAAARRRRARWAVPVSVAAVVVLAMGVALRVQIEEPQRPDVVALEPKVMQEPAAAPPAALESRARVAREAVAPAAAPAPQVGARKQVASADSAADRAAPAGRMASGLISGKADEKALTPQQWLERIAELREAGKAREADESLREFRQRHPHYRIPEPMRARVAPR